MNVQKKKIFTSNLFRLYDIGLLKLFIEFNGNALNGEYIILSNIDRNTIIIVKLYRYTNIHITHSY